MQLTEERIRATIRESIDAWINCQDDSLYIDFATTAIMNLLAAHNDGAQEPIGYLPAYEHERLQSGHNANLRSARFGPSQLDGDVAVYLDQPSPMTDAAQDKQIDSLESRNSQQKKTISEMCQQIADLDSVVEFMNLRNNEQHDNLVDKCKQIQQQALEYMSLFDQCSAALEKVAELERKHKEAFDDCGELNTANHELLAACGEKDRRIAELERQKDEAEKHAAEVSRANFELEAQLDRNGRDAERLDFVVDKQAVIVAAQSASGVWHYQLFQICEYGTGFVLSEKDRWFGAPREAIDAAISANKGERG